MSAIADPVVRDTLSRLLQVIFPLGAWLKSDGKYVPPGADKLPWRAPGGELSAQTLQTIARFEQLIDADREEEHLRKRWLQIAAAPRWREPSLPYPADWRAQRKLDDAAVFAPLDSDNFTVTTDDPKTKLKRPRARPEFYAACWPLLLAARAECLFSDDASWADFAKNLFNDMLSAWSPSLPVKSSDFVKRFAKDLCIALLDQENPLLPPTAEGDLWRRAVLIEAGEHRFRHNAYTGEQLQLTVQVFDAALQRALTGSPA